MNICVNKYKTSTSRIIHHILLFSDPVDWREYKRNPTYVNLNSVERAGLEIVPAVVPFDGGRDGFGEDGDKAIFIGPHPHPDSNLTHEQHQHQREELKVLSCVHKFSRSFI